MLEVTVRQKGYNTWCSQAVSHPSTNQAPRCLTSVIGREPVHSTWYGRSHWQLKQNWFCIWQHSFIQHCFTHLAIFFHFFRCILMIIFLKITWFKLRCIGQQTTFAVCFQIKLINRVGILTYLIGLSQQLGWKQFQEFWIVVFIWAYLKCK